MTDREKVIGLLQEMAEYFRECRSNASFASKAENHFWELQNAANEVVELLKEKEPKSPVVREKNGYWDYVCPTCGSRDEELFREWNYCPFCGQGVKWDDATG